MRHALITGGSRGIGAAAVRAFTAAGYAVSFFYEKNDAAAAAVSAETGAEAVRCDVADAQAVLDAVSCLPETDVLVNNAGEQTPAESILDCLSADEVAQLNALTEKLILSCKDKGINGKKKGRKAHSCHCC